MPLAHPAEWPGTCRISISDMACIRVNDQYRLCFVWDEAGPRDVEIVDYH